MEVRWSLPAADDLQRICEWIERDNPEAARRVARTIYDGSEGLKQLGETNQRAIAAAIGRGRVHASRRAAGSLRRMA
jgi:plasmid stabilization system protein ParE